MLSENLFPSPYRGYHLSTNGKVLYAVSVYTEFPSPYRGYHLSTHYH